MYTCDLSQKIIVDLLEPIEFILYRSQSTSIHLILINSFVINLDSFYSILEVFIASLSFYYISSFQIEIIIFYLFSKNLFDFVTSNRCDCSLSLANLNSNSIKAMLIVDINRHRYCDFCASFNAIEKFGRQEQLVSKIRFISFILNRILLLHRFHSNMHIVWQNCYSNQNDYYYYFFNQTRLLILTLGPLDHREDFNEINQIDKKRASLSDKTIPSRSILLFTFANNLISFLTFSSNKIEMKKMSSNRSQQSLFLLRKSNFLFKSDRSKKLSKFVMILIAILIITIQSIDFCNAKVKIHRMKVPKYIENGTVDSVQLDCLYSIDPEVDRNLVVKWFFREDPEPIYQWIVEHNLRRVPQRYQDKVDVNYITPNQTEPWQRYRSLNLIRPTVEMTGRYSCHVISIISEAHDSDTMIVYSKIKSINLVARNVVRRRSSALISDSEELENIDPFSIASNNYNNNNNNQGWKYQNRNHKTNHKTDRFSSEKTLSSQRLFEGASIHRSDKNQLLNTRLGNEKGHLVTATEVECSVDNVYPLPELTIYQVLDGDGIHSQRPRSLEKAHVHQNSTKLSNGAYRVSMTVSIDDEDLWAMSSSENAINNPYANKPTIFECLVSQDELKHELRRNTIYQPIQDSAQSWNNRKFGNDSITFSMMGWFPLIANAYIAITLMMLINHH
ncbi:hypothetical protein SSS_03488 [Sarcoptes scabiei]|uniref:Ig-like domain-containing protein n=1 Tax=Sarcoptes scabiei TaxID=52283 RepID=A0A834RHH9_SARSC|nr:hypothetical protein SSS_03488 [Sarcoptes scabiei]